MDTSIQSLLQAYRALSPTRRRLVAIGGALIALLLLVLVSSGRYERSVRNLPSRASLGGDTPSAGGAFPPTDIDALIQRDKVRLGPRNAYDARPNLLNSDGQPQISYSAELCVATKEFARARSSMEEIL